MKKLLSLLVLLFFAGQTALSQNVRGELAAAYSSAESKFSAMAGALSAEQLAWRPGDGVRSASEVFNHVAGVNYLLPGMIGCANSADEDAPQSFGDMADFEKATDSEVIRSRIAASFNHLRACTEGLSDDALSGEMEWFGMTGSGQSFMYFLLGHMSEHLGQSIAYLRTNGVTPPWSS